MAEGQPQEYIQLRRPNQWDEEWAFATTKQLKEIDSKCNVTLIQLQKLIDAATGSGKGEIIPELEAAIKKTGLSVKAIDRKVVDKKSKPPKHKQPKRKK